MNTFLVENWYQEEKINKKSLRDAFGEALVELAVKNKKIVVLTGDLCSSLRLDGFKRQFPDRFYQIGVAEQNMVGMAAGMALQGFRPVVGSFGTFLTGRAWEFIRVQVCLNRLPVILVGSHAGLSHPQDGVTAQATEDIALMQVLPHMEVIAPADASQVKGCLKYALNSVNPVYLRITREPTPVFLSTVSIEACQPVRRLVVGNDLTMACFGPLTYEVLKTVNLLKKNNISAEIISFVSLKPLSVDILISSLKKTGRLLCVEDHQIIGGFGSSLARIVAQHYPVPITFIGLNGFGQTARTYTQLLKAKGLDRTAIVKEIKRLLKP